METKLGKVFMDKGEERERGGKNNEKREKMKCHKIFENKKG
jgi:hypothetical protein